MFRQWWCLAKVGWTLLSWIMGQTLKMELWPFTPFVLPLCFSPYFTSCTSIAWRMRIDAIIISIFIWIRNFENQKKTIMQVIDWIHKFHFSGFTDLSFENRQNIPIKFNLCSILFTDNFLINVWMYCGHVNPEKTILHFSRTILKLSSPLSVMDLFSLLWLMVNIRPFLEKCLWVHLSCKY